MSILSRDQILGVSDIAYKDVPVPEWGGEVRIRSLEGWERDQFEHQLGERNGRTNARARLCALVIVDEKNERAFSPSDIKALGKKNSKALDRIFEEALTMNGLSKESQEELEKNSEPDPSDNSTSGLHSLSDAVWPSSSEE